MRIFDQGQENFKLKAKRVLDQGQENFRLKTKRIFDCQLENYLKMTKCPLSKFPKTNRILDLRPRKYITKVKRSNCKWQNIFYPNFKCQALKPFVAFMHLVFVHSLTLTYPIPQSKRKKST